MSGTIALCYEIMLLSFSSRIIHNPMEELPRGSRRTNQSPVHIANITPRSWRKPFEAFYWVMSNEKRKNRLLRNLTLGISRRNIFSVFLSLCLPPFKFGGKKPALCKTRLLRVHWMLTNTSQRARIDISRVLDRIKLPPTTLSQALISRQFFFVAATWTRRPGR